MICLLELIGTNYRVLYETRKSFNINEHVNGWKIDWTLKELNPLRQHDISLHKPIRFVQVDVSQLDDSMITATLIRKTLSTTSILLEKLQRLSHGMVTITGTILAFRGVWLLEFVDFNRTGDKNLAEISLVREKEKYNTISFRWTRDKG